MKQYVRKRANTMQAILRNDGWAACLGSLEISVWFTWPKLGHVHHTEISKLPRQATYWTHNTGERADLVNVGNQMLGRSKRKLVLHGTVGELQL